MDTHAIEKPQIYQPVSFITDPFRQKLLLGAVALGGVMDGIDGSIVNVALPMMASYFGTDTGTIAWVTITYLLMMAGLLLVFGKAAEQGRTKQLFLAGFFIFTIGSAACGFAPTLEILLAARVLQGTGAAMIAAVAPLLCLHFLPKEILGTALGVIAATTSAGYAAGPAIGGIITQYFSWHWIFLINIPIGIAGILFAARVIPGDAHGHCALLFDYPGALMLFGSMVFWIFALEEIPARSAADTLVLTCIALGILCVGLFVARELTTPDPFLNLQIFASWKFSSVLTAYLLINVIFTGIMYLLPFYLATGMHFDNLTSGLYLLLPAGIVAIISVFIGKWSDRIRRRRPFAVFACVLVVLYSILFSVIAPDSGIVPLIAGLILIGISFGFASAPVSSRIIEMSPHGERSTGSSLMVTAIYFGSVLGTAIYAAVFTFVTLDAGTVVDFAHLNFREFLDGFHITIAAGLVLSVVAVILSAIVPDAESAN